MGMIAEFFKSFFKEEAEDNPELIKIHVNDLSDWVRLRTEEIVYNHKLDETLTNYINKLKDKRWALEVKIDEWEKKIASLGLSYKTEDISTIFRESRKFLDTLTFPEKIKIKEMFEFNSEFEDKLEKLQKSIQESSFSYNYSFMLSKEDKGLELNPLMKELLDLSNYKDDFEKRVLRSGFTKMENLQIKAKLLEETRDKLEKLQDDIKNKSDKLKAVDDTKRDKESEYDSLQASPEISMVTKNEDRKVSLIKKREELDDILYSFFSKLKPALRKYVEVNSGSKLAKDYLENSTQTFYADEGLVILSILKDLKRYIDEEKITFYFSQKEEITLLINEADKLEKLHAKYSSVNRELEKLNVPSTITKEVSLKLEEAKYRLEHFTIQTGKLKEEIILVEEEIKDAQATFNRELELFTNLVKIAMGKEIEIKH